MVVMRSIHHLISYKRSLYSNENTSVKKNERFYCTVYKLGKLEIAFSGFQNF
jgi:hypothetical protein